jgi:hypothetical protein
MSKQQSKQRGEKKGKNQKEQQCYFEVEDTGDRCYRDIISALERRQWLPSPSHPHSSSKKSKFEKKLAISRPNVSSSRPNFLWTISEKALDFTSLPPHQIVNHFDGISALTTKNGVCDMLREMVWINQDHREVSPR